MELASVGFAFLAGLLSISSPCVLPLVPVVLSAAVSQHRLGPLALAGGLAVSFVVVGLFIATIGLTIGLGDTAFRTIGALLLVAIGLLLLLPPLQAPLAVFAGPIANWTDQRLGKASMGGLRGQFGVGLLLGVIWTPCVGPTLGAASLLAARRENLGEVTLIMVAFALGTALPLLTLGTVSREALMRWRGRLIVGGHVGKAVLGAALTGGGALVLTGLDKRVEAFLVERMPDWLLALTTQY